MADLLVAYSPCFDCKDKPCSLCELNMYRQGILRQEKWISVEDRLPEASGIYLVYSCLGTRLVLDYSAKHKLFNSFDSWSKKAAEALAIGVTHWMPLPEPPEMKGGE